MNRKEEDGYASLLVLGFTMIAIAVAGLTIDGTRAFLFRRSLQNAADAAALAGASEVDRQTYYRSAGRQVILDPSAAEARSRHWLGLRGLDADATIAASDDRVTVVLRGSVDTTFLRVIGISTLPVGVESLARPMTDQP